MAHGNEISDSVPLSDDAMKAKSTEMQEFSTALESGNLHFDLPFERRAEAKMTDLRRRIAIYESILERRAYSRKVHQAGS
jgi:hypothetical protein